MEAVMAVYPIYFASAGVPETGLTPSWLSMKEKADGDDIGSPPAISEIGGGWYKFDYTPAEDIVGVIDGGSSLDSTDRYISVYLTPADYGLQTVQSKLPSKAYLTGTTNSDGDIQADEVTGNLAGTVTLADGGITADKIASNAIALSKIAADLKTGDNLNAQVKGQDNIDFGALQKASLNAATPAAVTGAVGSVTGNVGGNVAGSIGSVTSPVTVGTNNDKSGYALATPPGDATAVSQAEIDAKLTTIASYVDTEIGQILSAISTLLTEARAKALLFQRENTVNNGQITDVVAGGDVAVHIEYDSGGVPTIQELS
jgi:hypothetical protein